MSRWESATIDLPEHWAPLLINGDDNGEYSPEELQAVYDAIPDYWEVTGIEENDDGEWNTWIGRYDGLQCTMVSYQIMRRI